MVKKVVVSVEKAIEPVEDLAILDILQDEIDESDDELQAPILPVKKVKKKLVITDKDRERRIEQLKPAREILKKNVDKRREIKATEDSKKNKIKEERIKQLQIEEEERMERLIIRKALAIKKRNLKASAIIDEIEDDNTPIEEVRKLLKPKKQQIQPDLKPKFYFV